MGDRTVGGSHIAIEDTQGKRRDCTFEELEKHYGDDIWARMCIVPTDEDPQSLQTIFRGGEPGTDDAIPDMLLSDLLKATGMEDPEQVSTQNDFVMRR